MKKHVTLLFPLFVAAFSVECIAQTGSGSFNLGSQITNGVTAGGCDVACNPTYCSPTGSGNHTVSTAIGSIPNVVAGEYLKVTLNSNDCGTTFGLDAGDNIDVNGVHVVTGSGNLDVNNVVSCYFNNTAVPRNVPVAFSVNRRDETINVAWETYATLPPGCATAANLPITLVYINATPKNGIMLLEWVTSSEENNDYFSLERSANGLQWDELISVKGAGTSQQERHYEYADQRPLQGKNYYRLRQVDFDGKFSYSPVVSATIGQAGGIRLSPQPVLDQLSVALEQSTAEATAWQVYDFAGRLLQAGTLEAETTNFQIPTVTLTEGSYVLRLVSGQTVLTQQFQKR